MYKLTKKHIISSFIYHIHILKTTSFLTHSYIIFVNTIWRNIVSFNSFFMYFNLQTILYLKNVFPTPVFETPPWNQRKTIPQ